jgi:hypothetical protein
MPDIATARGVASTHLLFFETMDDYALLKQTWPVLVKYQPRNAFWVAISNKNVTIVLTYFLRIDSHFLPLGLAQIKTE